MRRLNSLWFLALVWASLGLSEPDEVLDLDWEAYAKEVLGLRVEVGHRVSTEDGYSLALFRIPRKGRPVVFLQHG